VCRDRTSLRCLWRPAMCPRMSHLYCPAACLLIFPRHRHCRVSVAQTSHLYLSYPAMCPRINHRQSQATCLPQCLRYPRRQARWDQTSHPRRQHLLIHPQISHPRHLVTLLQERPPPHRRPRVRKDRVRPPCRLRPAMYRRISLRHDQATRLPVSKHRHWRRASSHQTSLLFH